MSRTTAAAGELKSINPFDGSVMRSFPAHDEREVDEKLRLAFEAQRSWRKVPVRERVEVLSRAAEILESEAASYGRLMTLEMGKPIGPAAEEARKCARACRYYVENAEALLTPREIRMNGAQARVRFDPIGPVLAVMPWNFPFWQVIRFAAPAIAGGNTGLLKHASNVPQCALALEELFLRAGAPRGVFQTLLVPSSRVAELIRDERIAAVTLTGSEKAGSSVGSEAGKQIKKTVLELGGSDPFIVMPSADLDEAIDAAVKARTINNGQSCIAAKRFIVHETVHERFVRGMVEGMRALRVGDPLDPATDVGPLATREIQQGVAEQVARTVDRGAKVLLGGAPEERPGFFYPPTVLSEIPPGTPGFDEEIFGPVALVFRVKNLDEALALANGHRYGLGASFWSQDPAEQLRFETEIEAGLAFINSIVVSDPKLPFGGVKRSGYGRELADFGFHEFLNIKSVSARS